MKKKNNRYTTLLFCIMLTAIMSLCTMGCSDSKSDDSNKASAAPAASEETPTQDNVLGVGETTFTFIVADKDGNETTFEIHTDKDTVGEALMDLDLISGDEGDYGLYVKNVNGITADYDTDQTYWAFYVNDEYAQTGVEQTVITEGETYSFRIEK